MEEDPVTQEVLVDTTATPQSWVQGVAEVAELVVVFTVVIVD